MRDLSELLTTYKLDAVLITTPQSLFRATGFQNDDAALLIDRQSVRYFTDKRYSEEAEKKIDGVTLVQATLMEDLAAALTAYNTVGYEGNMPHTDYLRLLSGKQTVDITDDLAQLRLVKTPYELRLMESAARINDLMFEGIADAIRTGVTEKELKCEVEYRLCKLGADGVAFDTIVAFGANTSVPHHRADDTALKCGDLITIDCGARFGGYCSDITRTFCYGNLDSEAKKVYNTVWTANQLGIDYLMLGKSCRAVDTAVRDYIAKAGYEGLFTHSLGHGVGIDIHEAPYLSPRSTQTVVSGSTVTIEPGIYIAGKYGVRIEDLLYVDGLVKKLLSGFDKRLICL